MSDWLFLQESSLESGEGADPDGAFDGGLEGGDRLAKV